MSMLVCWGASVAEWSATSGVTMDGNRFRGRSVLVNERGECSAVEGNTLLRLADLPIRSVPAAVGTWDAFNAELAEL